MRSAAVTPGQTGTADQYNKLRDDAFGGSQLLAHQQASANMTLYVEAGVFYIGVTRVIFGGGNSPSFTAPTSHPRIDILTIDSSGTLAITQGTEATSPVVPSYPANKAVLCEIYNRVAETSIKDADDSTNGYIQNDVRPVIAPPYISSVSQVASGLFLVDPGGEAQGAVPFQGASALQFLAPGTSGFVLQSKGASANPAWALMAQTATVKDVSGQNITPNCDNTYYTIATYTGIPALVANQTLWIRAYVTNGDGHGTNTQSFKLTVNGTDLAILTAPANNESTSYYWDIFLVVTNPASAQKFFGTVVAGTGAGTTVPISISSGSIAANLSSSFSLTIQGKENVSGSPASTGPWTVVACEVNILN